jgi:hypothetical protein
MSITAYLDGFDADLETKQVLGVALEKTRVSLGLADNFANGIIAKRLIDELWPQPIFDGYSAAVYCASWIRRSAPLMNSASRRSWPAISP